MSLHPVALAIGKPNHDNTAMSYTEDIMRTCDESCFRAVMTETLGPDAWADVDTHGKVWIKNGSAFEVIKADTESDSHVYCAGCGDAVICAMGGEDRARHGCDASTGTCNAPSVVSY